MARLHLQTVNVIIHIYSESFHILSFSNEFNRSPFGREELLKPKDANLADDSEDDDNCLPLVD